MKTKPIVLFVFCVFILFSCKDEKSKQVEDSITVAKQSENDLTTKENVFSVQLKVLFQKDDALEVFYLENESDTYSAERMKQVKIKGLDDFQEVEFKFPKEVYPYNIRLDLGFNKNQDPIKISECTLSYNNHSFVIKANELKTYFTFNGGVEIQSDSLTFKLKPFDLHGKQVFDPYVVGNKNLETALMTKL